MELKLKKAPVFLSELLADTSVEQPVECDALLPDYCPDIVRILKCTVTPTVASRRVKGQRLEIEGMTAITVFYTSQGPGIHKAEYKVPFSRAVELKSEPAVGAVSVQARPGYVSCRAVNQRRLDIRGAVVMVVFVLGCREEQAVCGGEGAGIQLREESCTGSRLLGQESRDIRINETLELSYGKQPIQDILRCCATPRLVECKAGDGKAVIKGELAIHLLYQHAGGCDQMDFTVPTAAVVEMPGLSDQCQVSVCQEVAFCNLEPAADREGEYRNLLLEAGLVVTVKAECSYQMVTCTDCYSTKCQCSFRTRSYNTLQLEANLHEPMTIREVMPLPDNIETVLDLWCDLSSLTFRSEQSCMVADARVLVSMLGRMKDGEVYYFDKNLELSERLPMAPAGCVMDGRMTVAGSGFSFTANDAIEVRCDLMLDGSAYQSRRCMGVDEVAVDEKKPRADLQPSGLYLYLASQGEPVWDIAKRYNTSVARIMEENPPTEGRDNHVLIIPVV